MTQRTEQIALLEEEILREEKRFLMEKYAALLLLQAELAESEAAAEGGEPVGLEDCVVESLQVAHAYVNPEMAVQISELLEAHGHEIEVSDSESGDGEHDSAEETDDLLGANGDDETAADEETESLFDDSDEPDSLIETTDAEDVVEAGSPDGLAEPAEQEGEGLFDDAEAAPQEDGASEPAGEGADEDEEAGVLFADDIYSGNEGEARDRGSEEGAGGFTPTEGHEQEETAGFTPTKGHEQEETPGFIPTKGHEQEGTPGFTPTEGHEQEETPKRPPSEQAAETSDRQSGDKRKRPETAKDPRASMTAAERAAKLKKAQEERRARIKQQQEAAQEESEEELDLDALTYQISLDDLEQYLGISALPDDRANLEKRWQTKERDASLRQLLGDGDSMQHPYAILPRLPRFFKGGKTVNATVVELLRNYPQLFESPVQVINKYKGEQFFSRERPELDWVVVACEALPESLNRNSMEQKTFIRQYAMNYRVPERRIRRRKLVEALYDLIVINVITKENILSKTVDITESRVGRDGFAIIHYGEQGVRIGDTGRQQKDGQMGVCPGW